MQCQDLEPGLTNTKTHALHLDTRPPATEKDGKAPTGELLAVVGVSERPSTGAADESISEAAQAACLYAPEPRVRDLGPT